MRRNATDDIEISPADAECKRYNIDIAIHNMLGLE